jgi:hypothetical protein
MEEERDFYLVLPSNVASHTFPDNEPNHFFTPLHQPLYFDKPGWKVALKEMTFESNIQTIVDESMEVWSHYPDFEEIDIISLPAEYSSESKKIFTTYPAEENMYRIGFNAALLSDYREVYLISEVEGTEPRRTLVKARQGTISYSGRFKHIVWKLEGKRNEEMLSSIAPKPKYFVTPEKLVAALNSLLTAESNIKFEVVIEEEEKRVQLMSLPANKKLIMKQGMQFVLGYRQSELTKLKKADFKVDLSRGAFSMFVYCDMVEPIMVGDASVPLLRTTHLHAKEYGATVNQVFNPPMYMKICKSQVNMIEIDIRTDTGEPFPISKRGKLILTLHFLNDSIGFGDREQNYTDPSHTLSCKYRRML